MPEIDTQSYNLITSHLTDESLPKPEIPARLLTSWEKTTLKRLSHMQVTSDILINRDASGGEFDYNHFNALKHLLEQKNMTAEVAVDTLAGLSEWQAWGIYPGGLTHEEVKQLPYLWQINSLSNLKASGLTIKMLVDCPTPDMACVSLEYYDALYNLTKNPDNKLSAPEALNLIKQLYEESEWLNTETKHLMQLNFKWYIKALAFLSLNHFLQYQAAAIKLKSESDCNELGILIVNKKIPVDLALAAIEGADSSAVTVTYYNNLSPVVWR